MTIHARKHTSAIADAGTTGAEGGGKGLTNRYLRRALRAAHTSIPVSRQLTLVRDHVAPTKSLFTPAMVARVLLAERRSRARVSDSRRRPASLGSPTQVPVPYPWSSLTVPQDLR